MSRKTRIALLAVPLLLALLDLWTKSMAGEYPKPPGSPPLPGRVVIQDWLEIQPTWNPGALFGFDMLPPWLLTALTGLAVPLLLWWIFLHPKEGLRESFGKLLILSGALGNLYDRIADGMVRDFINVYYGSMEPGAKHWPTFNLADAALVCGVILLVLMSFLPGAARPEGKAA